MTVEPQERVQMTRHSRKFIQFYLVTTPAITSWEMSFDDGVTWFAGSTVPGSPDNYRWLVAGDGVAIGTAIVQLGAGEYELLVRAVSDPELEVTKAILSID